VIDYLPTCGELAAYLDREANLPDDEKGPGGSLGARSGGAVRISATIPIAARRSARQQRRQLRIDVFAERELDTIPFDLRGGRTVKTEQLGDKTGTRKADPSRNSL